MDQQSLLIHVNGVEGTASLHEIIDAGAGALAGDLDGFGLAILVQGTEAGSVAAFRLPEDDGAAEWLRRCRGSVAPGLSLSVGPIDQATFRWIGPGAEAATSAGADLSKAKLPNMPDTWLSFLAARRDSQNVASLP